MALLRGLLIPSEESIVADLLLFVQLVFRGQGLNEPVFFCFMSSSPTHLFPFYQKHLVLPWQFYKINLLLFAQPWPSQEESVRALLLMRSLIAFARLSWDGHTCAPGWGTRLATGCCGSCQELACGLGKLLQALVSLSKICGKTLAKE